MLSKENKPKKIVKSYCEIASNDAELKQHHDVEHGYPCRDTAKLYEYLMLEIMMAGLSWKLIVRKRANLQSAFANFDPYIVAKYDDKDVADLLQNAGIIRSVKKIAAAIHNAKSIVRIESEGKSFAEWLDSHHPLKADEWLKLLRTEFKFIGLETIKEFLTGIGYLPGAHDKTCLIYKAVEKQKPAWLSASK